MTAERRVVRATSAFFDDLDRLLGPERGPNGEPSTNDFQAIELLRIVEVVAADFSRLPRLIADRDDYRVLVTTGVLAAGITVTAQLAPDGAVELVSLDIDLGGGRW